MTFYDRLVAETEDARCDFVFMPAIERALNGDVPLELYRDFLAQAYHHVRHTCPLLALAASRTDDARYQEALITYLDEELGHDQWILDDIGAVGGDPRAVENGKPNIACRAMVAYAYYAIERISPYALLGMVHVLEGMSVQLASRAASAIQQSYRLETERGVRYLRSHGTLDIEHTAFFRTLVDGIDDPAAEDVIIDSAIVFYRLYGNIFRELMASHRETVDAD